MASFQNSSLWLVDLSGDISIDPDYIIFRNRFGRGSPLVYISAWNTLKSSYQPRNFWHTTQLDQVALAGHTYIDYHGTNKWQICHNIHACTSDYLRYPRRKQTVTSLPTTSEKRRRTNLQNAHIFHVFHFYAYRVPICDTDELRKCLIATWAEFWQSVVDDAVDQWRKRLEACVCAEGGHFEHLL